mmetsp:Transcript_91320/g.244528  ORF Transcript_91320/g.244528 Transcript_91320/m.244528 type:complete len:244 (-) Transcript_91320:276-1007(-)
MSCSRHRIPSSPQVVSHCGAIERCVAGDAVNNSEPILRLQMTAQKLVEPQNLLRASGAAVDSRCIGASSRRLRGLPLQVALGQVLEFVAGLRGRSRACPLLAGHTIQGLALSSRHGDLPHPGPRDAEVLHSGVVLLNILILHILLPGTKMRFIATGKLLDISEQAIQLDARPPQQVGGVAEAVHHLLVGRVGEVLPQQIEGAVSVGHEGMRAGPEVHVQPHEASQPHHAAVSHGGLAIQLHVG